MRNLPIYIVFSCVISACSMLSKTDVEPNKPISQSELLKVHPGLLGSHAPKEAQ